MTAPDRIRSLLRDVPDFPKPGILFKDISPLLRDHAALEEACLWVVAAARGWRATVIAGIEARGFIFGAGAAVRAGLGFVPLRKRNKLPYTKISESYSLEYGQDSLEGHADAFTADDRVLVVDDVLATGGTASAACRLVERIGGTVAGCAFVVELEALRGRERLNGRELVSLVTF